MPRDLRRLVSFHLPRAIALGVLLSVPAAADARSSPILQGDELAKRLLAEDPAALVRDARQRGDATRGATLFFQPALSCARCHDHTTGSALGPDLTRPETGAKPEHLVESVLAPSKTIRKGYETVIVEMSDGRSITGLVASDTADELVLLDPAAAQGRTRLAKREIEKRSIGRTSLMPEGLTNILSDRQQFLDLVRYLLEIGEKGPARADQLRPAQTGLILPEYEKNIDHAGLIRSLDAKALERGAVIYERVCANCHGTHEKAGSLPTSPRFATARLKNGSDPHAMYQTLTRGYGMMAPQTWMVPRQKYDVIHYIRERYFREHNPSQYRRANREYLAELPKGGTFGPAPATVEPWAAMDYGPAMHGTFEVGGPGLRRDGVTAGPTLTGSVPIPNVAMKGIAVRLDPGAGGVSRGRRHVLFDHELGRVAAVWSGERFLDWHGIHFDGRHGDHPHLVGDLAFANPVGPGWADPDTGSFADPRPKARDGRPYGPLPRRWHRHLGLYSYGDRTIARYEVGGAEILESWGRESAVDAASNPNGAKSSPPGATANAAASPGESDGIFTRTLEIGRSTRDLLTSLGPAELSVAIVGDTKVSLERRESGWFARIPAAATPTRVKVLLTRLPKEPLDRIAASSPPPASLRSLTEGGPRRWPEVLKTGMTAGTDQGPFATDVFELPARNPWNAQLRLTGIEFTPAGDTAYITAWDGDVWKVRGFDRPDRGLEWRRIASGLFQPLGVRLRGDDLFVTCRDQLVRLKDLNGDDEIDFLECFNSDHQVTEHFHEFAMGLAIDPAGNFLYAKSARHALKALVPHHGTLLRVKADGSATEILATGFRAANGVCLNPDGSVLVTDQEGHWTPKNRINLVRPGGFYGNLWGFTDITDTSDAKVKPPICWITNEFDRSPGELIRVEPDLWRGLKGLPLNLSYGTGRVFVVPYETVDGEPQGGMCPLPLPEFPTGVMRGRFHPDGSLYACGMFAWAGNRTDPGGLYRIRPTGKPMDLPVAIRARKGAVEVSFTDPLSPATADSKHVEARVWNLKRSANYGSNHLDERSLKVSAVRLPDPRTVRIELPDLGPTMGMELRLRLVGADGRVIDRRIHLSIHRLGDGP
jgi:putative heme-binding domain-containing protein